MKSCPSLHKTAPLHEPPVAHARHKRPTHDGVKRNPPPRRARRGRQPGFQRRHHLTGTTTRLPPFRRSGEGVKSSMLPPPLPTRPMTARLHCIKPARLIRISRNSQRKSTSGSSKRAAMCGRNGFPARLYFQLYPRVAAHEETARPPKKVKNYDDFLRRMAGFRKTLDIWNIPCTTEEIKWFNTTSVIAGDI